MILLTKLRVSLKTMMLATLSKSFMTKLLNMSILITELLVLKNILSIQTWRKDYKVQLMSSILSKFTTRQLVLPLQKSLLLYLEWRTNLIPWLTSILNILKTICKKKLTISPNFLKKHISNPLRTLKIAIIHYLACSASLKMNLKTQLVILKLLNLDISSTDLILTTEATKAAQFNSTNVSSSLWIYSNKSIVFLLSMQIHIKTLHFQIGTMIPLKVQN